MNRAVKFGAAVAMLAIGALAAFLLFGDDVALTPEPEPVTWPLTGEVAPDEAAVRARAVSVKVENSPQARPQAGLAEADVVYETIAEGGIPRFNAIFHSSAPDRVGPIRSARLSDVYLVPQYDALFAYSGANQTVRDRIAEAGIDDLGMERNAALYERDPARSAPHDVYSSVAALRAASAGAGFSAEGGPRAWLFGPVPGAGPAGGEDAAAEGEAAGEAAVAPAVASVLVPFAGNNDARWTWDAEAGRWQREVGGAPHADEGSSERYAAANVIILYAESRETGMRDTAGSPVLDIRLDAEGDAVVLREGRRYDVRWSAFRDAPPRFETADGEPFPLAVGRTWIQVVPPGHGVVIE